MNAWVSLLALGSLSLVACSPIVLDPIGEQGAGGGGGGGAPGGGGGGGQLGLAMRLSDLSNQTRAGIVGNEDPSADPDSLVLFLATRGQSCASPMIPTGPMNGDCSGSAFTQLALVIPPYLARPATLDLRNRRIDSYFGILSADCGGGYGYEQGATGTLAIQSSTPTSIAVDLDIGEMQFSVLDGHHELTFCGDPPPAPPPIPGVAMLGANLPPGAIGSQTVDPTALYVFAGTAATTCAAPTSSIACSHSYRTTLVIPAAKQTPGTLDLDTVDAGYDVSWEASNCDVSDREHGALKHGTVEITSVDASSVSFQISGSFVSQDSFVADGVYTASMCP